MVQVISLKRSSHLLKVCDIVRHRTTVGLEHAKNINNLFAEKIDVRKVENIN